MTEGDAGAFAPAKVNLALHVTGRRFDGRHELDSLVAFADVGDRLCLAPGDGLRVDGPFAAGVPTDGTNLVLRALRAAGAPRAVALRKNLPHPAGIGGGSSDAAAALRAVGAVLDVDTLMALGADLPVCMPARAARMRGAGERVEPVAMPPLHAVLVNPGVPVPTGAVFAALERRDGSAMGAVPDVDAEGLVRWLAGCRNDLQAPARATAPAVGEGLDALRAAGATLARMSGSGATCFGLWPTRRAAEAAAEALRRPGWWVEACTLA
ncbi:4-(cytidine 5'-diphospho)-2-C-methyl-D-erythritol kinase [Jannaschia sp. W003]|uniref:4-(cytidine 5'-diphospho)-2-C-methyl-D-erythritol kinase n=1 Tax=Jannaschia sp. W003 TaxID=2867012 RepID=UPI0021A68DC9|nr:4-(cytidine 5'-diphospho)-2-C-methyl-D-erythritol kinase [Jannaschia sp. W003]UWQ22865.1 4-(cytidine 5'-diphospho)-2-C-methyl-D-erythritol kinase [Jannaschia sp. W003]